MAGRIAASDIPVQWSAVETGSGLRGYDVEWRIKLGEFAANGDWTPWLTATTQTQATFSGTLGVAYTFPSTQTLRVCAQGRPRPRDGQCE